MLIHVKSRPVCFILIHVSYNIKLYNENLEMSPVRLSVKQSYIALW